MTDPLERELRGVALLLDVSEERSLIDDVLARLDVAPPARAPWRDRRRVVAVVAAGLVAAVAIPGPRHAIANFFGLGSTRIEQAPVPSAGAVTTPASVPMSAAVTTASVPASEPEPVPESVPVTLPTALRLGQPVTAAVAAEQTGLPVPQTTELGERAGIFVVEPPESGQIIVVYNDRDQLALLSTVAGVLDDGSFVKQGVDGTTVEFLQVQTASAGEAEAVWLGGEPHWYMFQSNDDATLYQDTLRLASNTLLWQVGDVMYRLESQLSRDEAVRVAGTVTNDAVS